MRKKEKLGTFLQSQYYVPDSRTTMMKKLHQTIDKNYHCEKLISTDFKLSDGLKVQSMFTRCSPSTR